jgi:hypothetical protein
MDDSQNRTLQTAVRVRGFDAQHIADFSESGVARQLFNQLVAGIANVESLAAAQFSGIGKARQGTKSRNEARLALREAIDAIFRVARIMGIDAQFQRLTGNSDEDLISTATAYATHALPLKSQFIAHEMPADFIDDLNDNVAALRASIATQGDAVGDHVAASAALDEAVDDLVENMRNQDGFMKNKYANNPGVLAEWLSASHIERAPRRTKATEPPPPPTTSGQ